MPSATLPGVTYLNKAPLLFCSPGNKGSCLDAIKSSGDFDSPSPWPADTELRVKILPGGNVHTEIVEIIKKAVGAWMNGLGQRLGLQWVGSDDVADIRISFRNDVPNWGALGARATLYDQIYSHKYIARVAAHLFGHALGLPHARTSCSMPWNEAELVKNYGSFFGPMIKSAKGCDQLQSPQSIMGFDRPAALGSGTDECRGGNVIDDEARKLLEALYPKTYPVFSREVCRSRVPGWSGGTWPPVATQRFDATQTANIITGLCRIDMGLGGGFRVKSYVENVQSRSGFNISLRGWQDNNMIDATCAVLSFAEEDQRVQTGRMGYLDMRTANVTPTAGVGYYKRVNFARPFKKVPKVVTFFSRLDSEKGPNLRLEVGTDEINCYGFTLAFGPWGDTTAWSPEATWLAHEPDDPSIRSGTFYNPNTYPSSTLELKPRLSYDTPMRKKPQTMFCAFSYLDGNCGHNIRLEYQLPDWNENSVEGRFATWAEESRFYGFRGVYVAVL